MTDDYKDTVVDVLEDNEDHVEDYLDGEDGAMNFLIGQVLQATGGSINPSDARDELESAIQGIYGEQVDWPVEVEYYHSYNDEAAAEHLWHELRESYDSFNEDSVPSLVGSTLPEFNLPLSVEQDGTAHLGRGKAIPDDDLYCLLYGDRYSFNEKVEELGVPDTDEAYEQFNYCPYVNLWVEHTGDSLDPVGVEIDGTSYVLVEK